MVLCFHCLLVDQEQAGWISTCEMIDPIEKLETRSPAAHLQGECTKQQRTAIIKGRDLLHEILKLCLLVKMVLNILQQYKVPRSSMEFKNKNF